MPGMVLMTQSASAPAATTACAIRPMLGTLGASLTMTGMPVPRSAALTTWPSPAAAASALAGVGFTELTVHVGAGDVDLQQVGPGLGDRGRHRAELLRRTGKDAGNEGHAERLKPRFALASSSTSASAPGLASPMALISPWPQSRQEGLT